MRICYDDNGLSWRHVAEDYAAQSGEVLFDHEATSEELTAAFSGYTTAKSNVSLKEQIATLEALQTPRLLRQAQLSSAETFSTTDVNFAGMTAAQALTQIETKIAALRAQLK
jgi:hypothetical protein